MTLSANSLLAFAAVLAGVCFGRWAFHSTHIKCKIPLSTSSRFTEVILAANIKYQTPAELNYRLQVFHDNVGVVERLNREYDEMLAAKGFETAKQPMFAAGVFALKTVEEVSASMLGLKLPKSGLAVAPKSDKDFEQSLERIDRLLSNARREQTSQSGLQKKPFVSIVRDQKECGGCWAFSAVLSLEKYAYELIGSQFEFSMQQLIDCDLVNNGCFGGWPTRTFPFVAENGIASYSTYPYKEAEAECKRPERTFSFGRKIHPDEWFYSHSKLRKLIDRGFFVPISITADQSLMHLSNSPEPFRPMRCNSSQVNHAVTVVAADENTFTIQNSWSEKWANKGFKKIYPCSKDFEMYGLPSAIMVPYA